MLGEITKGGGNEKKQLNFRTKHGCAGLVVSCKSPVRNGRQNCIDLSFLRSEDVSVWEK